MSPRFYQGFLLLPVLLSACGTPLDTLQRSHPEPHDFTSALATEYLGFAESEKEQGFGKNATRFAQKGLKAEKGEHVPPENPNDWNIPEDERVALEDARKQLNVALTEDTIRIIPQKAARAQMLYDCWMAQAERGQAMEDAACAEEFGSVIGDVLCVSASPVLKGEPQPEGVPACAAGD